MAKMKKTEVKPFKEMLLALRSRLRGDVSTMADAALSGKHGSGSSGVSNHMADMGSDTFEQNNTLMLMKNCLLYTSPSPRDQRGARMPSSA